MNLTEFLELVRKIRDDFNDREALRVDAARELDETDNFERYDELMADLNEADHDDLGGLLAYLEGEGF